MIEYLYSSTYTVTASPPDFSLTAHIQVFILASELQIPGLQSLACNLFNNTLNAMVTDLEVYFAAIKDIYQLTTYENPALRIVVVETAISEMRNILGNEGVRNRFHEVTSEVPEFQVCSFHSILGAIPEGEVLMSSCRLIS